MILIGLILEHEIPAPPASAVLDVILLFMMVGEESIVPMPPPFFDVLAVMMLPSI